MVNLEGLDVVFLQETHCSNIKEGKQWSFGYLGKCFWSWGQNHSCGVGILLSKTLSYTVLNFDFDFNGRNLVLDLLIKGVEYRFINVYLSNIVGERKEFLLNLAKYFVTKKNIVFGGDFNFVENLGLDKKGGNVLVGDGGVNELCQMKKDFALVDVFRTLFNNKREFTWEGVGERGKVLCRLDRFYVSKCLFNHIVSYVPVQSVISDHCLVQMSLNIDEIDCVLGPGYWKLNSSVLGDLNFKEDLKILCDRILLNVENIKPDVWDLFKEECKKLAKFHCKILNMVFSSKYKSVQKQFYRF